MFIETDVPTVVAMKQIMPFFLSCFVYLRLHFGHFKTIFKHCFLFFSEFGFRTSKLTPKWHVLVFCLAII